jgi:two-component sensor histidine kinase
VNTAKIVDADIRPADLLISRALLNSPERPPCLQAEVATFCELSRILADDPGVTLRRFLDDARVEQRAGQLVLGLKLLEQARQHRHTLALLESHRLAQRALAHALAEERSRREQVEAPGRGVGQALVFKDTAIRELHHRVRNTIQIAASLSSLHARATPCAQVRSTLQESYGRLRLLAKVHELLYASADSTQEILLPTLLRAMGDALRQSFAEMSGRVSLRVTCDQIVLPPDDAIPMALLANEVVSNAYKHAFPDGSSGEITINLRCAPENTVILQITDNGIGMRTRNAESCLGLKLIRGFAAQLHGALALGRPVDAAGTTVTLTIHRGAKRGHEPDRGEFDVASTMPAL